MENIRNRITIPVNFTARKSIKSEVAKALYNRVDSILAKIDRHEKTALKLVQELSLTLGRYKYKSQRKGFVEILRKNLDGVALSSVKGYMCVDIEQTSNKEDWKCVFTKSKDKTFIKKNRLPICNKDADFREYLIDLINEVIGGKKDNYRLYNSFVLYYSENLIRRAIGEYRELVALSKVKNKQGYFTAIMHTLCHKMNKKRIKDCDKNCKYRPENQFFPDNQ